MKDIYYFNCDKKHDPIFTMGGINKEWNEDVRKHSVKYEELLQVKNKTNFPFPIEELETMLNEGYSFWLQVVVADSMFEQDSYLVQLAIRYCNRTIEFYIGRGDFETFKGKATEPQEVC